MDGESNNIVRLKDGRKLVYEQRGDPSGKPLLHFHGVPSSRLEGQAIGRSMPASVRLVSVDRPGVGGSDPKPGRTLAGWAADVSELADVLGIERFAVLGYSGGGPYALACAHAFPERLTVTGVAAGFAPPAPGFLDGVGKTDRQLIGLTRRRAGWVAGLGLRMARRVAERKPERMHAQFEEELSEPDRAAYANPETREEVRLMFIEAMRQGPRAIVEDYSIYGRPWGFELEEISATVRIWHGDQDQLVPIRHSQTIAAAVPGAELNVRRGEGHLFSEAAWAEIAETLAPR
jgi:pimeloyl-ACP methyl ester carboxylesterase